MLHTFSRDERLSGRRLITALFSNGHVYHVHPFRITWMLQPGEDTAPAQVLFSVPKYNFRKAVVRNLIRRRMREAYRQNKRPLYESLDGTGRRLVFCVTYTAKEIMPFDLIQAKIIILLQRLIEENEKVTG